VFWCTKDVKFHFRWGTKPRDQKQETENECDVISGLRTSRKTDFSEISLFSYKGRTIVPFPGKLISSQWEKNDWRIGFPRSLESWNDVTFIPRLQILASRFCTPPEVKSHVFCTSKLGEGKSLSKIFFGPYLSVHWGNLIEQIKKISHINFNTFVFYMRINSITALTSYWLLFPG